ncbi:MAG: lamin tail domain-containing protein [Pirellulaceae bacterium]|nr:lamin tail domain-containing protein [Pirellulaceae bacterium]
MHRIKPNYSRRKSCRTFATELLEPRMVLASAPIISEFQAVNRSTMIDQDGDSSDWIELQNPGSQSMNVGGWFLTDDATDLTKWKLPAVDIDPGDQLLIFASAKDRIGPSELHTNFRLSGSGEFLALVQPDGVTIAQDFGVTFPPQREDQSYGLAQVRKPTVLVDGNSAVTSIVPTDDSLTSAWTTDTFNDANWLKGSGAVGFENLRPETTQVEEFATSLDSEWTIDLPQGTEATVEVSAGSLNFSVPTDQNTSFDARGLAPIAYRDLPVPDATQWEWIANIEKVKPGDRSSVGIMIYDGSTGKPALMLEQSIRRKFSFLSGGTEFGWSQKQQGNFWLRLSRDEAAKTWTASAKLTETDPWNVIATVTDGTFEGPVVSEPKLALFARTPVGTIDAKFLSVQFVAAAQRPTYDALIGLDIGPSMSNTNPSAYLRYAFQLDGDPNRFDVLSLGARYDDGFKAYLNGDEVTSVNAPISSDWNSSAASQHGAIFNKIPLEQFDLTDSSGLLRKGENVLAIHGMNVSADDPDFFFQGGLVASEVLNSESRFFTTPTPNDPNQLPSASEPDSVDSDGLFFGSQTVELKLPDGSPPTLQIRYTLDGSDPTEDSTLYWGPFTFTDSTLLQARTFDTLPSPNFRPSRVMSKTYIALDETLRERTSNLPLVVIDTLSQAIPATTTNDLRRAGVVILDVNGATDESSLKDGIVDYLGRGGIRRRGSSTGGQPKPQLAFESWGPGGTNRDDDFDASLLGMSAESDWVLHAPFGGDPIFMRNAMGFAFGNQMGRWAPQTRPVEVYLNDDGGSVSDSHYVGVYVLMEKIKPGPGRLDIEEIGPLAHQTPDISGGYIWKVDRTDPDAPAFDAGGQPLNWVYPESPLSLTTDPERKATEQQQQWVVDQFNALQQTLLRPDINDPDGYAKFIDVDAWIDYHLAQVVMYNADALSLSIFYHKDRNDKIAAGPLWDLNLTAESTRTDDDDPTRWRTGANFFEVSWWKDLFRDPGFWQQYIDRWQMWRQSVFSDTNISNVISELAQQIGDASDRNAVRWPNNAFRETSGYNSGFLDGSFQGEVDHMRHWMFARTRFLDDLFSAAPKIQIDGSALGKLPGVQLTSGQSVEISSAPIVVPVDTKLVSGVPGESVASYLVPTNDDLTDQWTLPDFDDADWQRGPTGLGFDENGDLSEWIRTEVDPRAVQDGATNILARIPFEISNLADLEGKRLILRMKFDDAYAAYLNGVRVSAVKLKNNELTWNARGTNQKDEEAMQFQEIDVTRHHELLVQGTNLLALRVLNSSASSNEMLLLPELVAQELTFETNPTAKVYYTVDGTDPRGADGHPSATAIESKPGQPLTIEANTRFIARTLDPSDRGEEATIVLSDWSETVQYDLVVTSSPLVISEINYNPTDPSDFELVNSPDNDGDGAKDWTSEDFEFIEIYNPSTNPADLVGVALTAGVDFDFTSSATALAAGHYGLVVRNQQAFETRYGSDHNILGQYEGRLDNNGEQLQLEDGAGTLLFAVDYNDSDPWPVAADGVGATLEFIDPNVSLPQQNKYYAWRSSRGANGSPGSPGQAAASIVINEILANTGEQADLTDAIELFNPTNSAIDISRWQLSDSVRDLRKFKIPDATILEPGQYIVFDEADFNPTPATPDPNHFRLSGIQGDDVWLTITDDQGQITMFVDDVHFRATSSGDSLARFPNGSGRLAPTTGNTLGTENADPRPAAVVVSEFNYAPHLPSEAALTIDPTLSRSDLEFIEVDNQTDVTVDMMNWQIQGGVDFKFDDGTMLTVNQPMIVVKFDPNDPKNARRLAAFRTHYQLDDDAPIVGGYAGQLNNSGDQIVLLRSQPLQIDRPDLSTLVQEDEVLFDDLAPWPENAAGTGNSLQRLGLESYGNDSRSWISDSPSPASRTELRGDFDHNRLIDAADIDLLFAAINAGLPDTDLDLTGDKIVNDDDRDVMVKEILGTHYGDANLDGLFNSTDLVSVFQASTYEDHLPQNATWESGDWNADGEFDSSDLVLAFQDGGYVRGAFLRDLNRPSALVEPKQPR